jgi:hypothetical protein
MLINWQFGLWMKLRSLWSLIKSRLSTTRVGSSRSTSNTTFGKRPLMAWNKLTDGRLAVMGDNGKWYDYTALPISDILVEPFPNMSKGWCVYQHLLKNRWILVRKEDY